MLTDKEKSIVTMWNKNMSGQEIGDELGITRNAVMGILNRLRLKGVVGYKVKPKTYRKRSQKPVEAPKPIAPPKAPPKPKPQPARNPDQLVMAVLEDRSLPPHGPVTLMKLHHRSCRYIVSDVKGAETLFCGRMKTTGAYCAEHHQLCYVPSIPKKKKVMGQYRS